MITAINGLLFSQLSGEIILICDDQLLVREVNDLARTTLGDHIVGRPLLQLIAAMARSKGAAFIDELQRLDGTGVTATWELMLHVPRSAPPLFVGMRGGRLPDGGWMIMASSESPRLAHLYHEALSINIELTNLIRELTREQATLTRTLNHLLARQEGGPMPSATEETEDLCPPPSPSAT